MVCTYAFLLRHFIKLRLTGHEYADSFQSKAGSEPPLHLNNLSLFWQIPAFCGDAIVVDQNYAKDRSKALQDHRAAKHNYTADIWERSELIQWISGPEPSVLVVQGTSQSAERLEKFSVELVDYLQGRCPTVFLLSPLPGIFYENSLSGGDGILRQIAVQCLRIIPSSVIGNTPNDWLSFLSKTTAYFQGAFYEDWFSSMEMSLSYREQVYIVLDISILRQHFRSALTWHAGFAGLIDRLQSQKTDLRVMILTGRSIDGDLGATTRIMSVDMAPRSPSHVYDLSESEKASVLFPQPNKPQVLVSLPAPTNNTETTKEEFLRNSMPSVLFGDNRKEERQNLVEGAHKSDLGSFQAADSGVTYDITYCSLSSTFLD